MAGHLLAIDRVLRICDQRARLLGLNRPERIEVSQGGVEDLDAVVRELITEITLRADGQPVPEE